MMEADARERQLRNFLDPLEQSPTDLQPPFDQRAKVWGCCSG